jgi:hypothetical protein
MKQVVQHLRSGQLELLDVPCPAPAAGHVLVQTTASVISPGTERVLVEFARGSPLTKARQQPQRVRQVWDKIKDKGHRQQIEQYLALVVEGGEPLIPPQELWDVARVTLAAAASLREQRTIALTDEATP